MPYIVTAKDLCPSLLIFKQCFEEFLEALVVDNALVVNEVWLPCLIRILLDLEESAMRSENNHREQLLTRSTYHR